MAKRGAALPDIKNIDDLDKFLEVKCLVVLNVYSGYFGPCNALATNLRDFKMISGGDDLQIASVNVDNIDIFKRFRKKSEPAYLMILNGKIVNSFFGCNVTALLNVIKEEIDIYKSGEEMQRAMVDLNEMSQIEAHRFRIMREDLIRGRKLEQQKNYQMVYDYRMVLTDKIMDNTADIGITVFMPHVLDKDLIKNLTEAAAGMSMTLKQHCTTKITKEHLEMINFDGENLSSMVFNHIRDRDVLIVAWKMGSGELKPINELFDEFAKTLSVELAFESEKGVKKAAKKKGRKGKKTEPEPVIQKTEGEEEEAPPFKLPSISVPLESVNAVRLDPIQIEPIDLQFIENERDVIKLICESITAFTNQRITAMHNECIKGELDNLIDRMGTTDDGNADAESEKPKKAKKKPAKVAKPGLGNLIIDPKKPDLVHVLPVWTPPSPRSHAAMLYVYFRKLLSFFLPLDPPGADRYVIVVFNVRRHEEILDFMKNNPNIQREGILAHGFFRGFVDGENFADTVLLCKTGIEYRLLPDSDPFDKLILQVVAQSEALLVLAELEPDFVSQNENDGRIESDVIFPLGYTSISEEEMEAEMEVDEVFGGGGSTEIADPPETLPAT